MNEIVSSLLLAGDKFMPEFISMITNIYRIHEFAYNTYRSFIKNKERKQKFKEIGDSRCIYQNKLDNACFQHDMASGNFEDLTRRKGSDKILHNKVFNIAKIWWTSKWSYFNGSCFITLLVVLLKIKSKIS